MHLSKVLKKYKPLLKNGCIIWLDKFSMFFRVSLHYAANRLFFGEKERGEGTLKNVKMHISKKSKKLFGSSKPRFFPGFIYLLNNIKKS